MVIGADGLHGAHVMLNVAQEKEIEQELVIILCRRMEEMYVLENQYPLLIVMSKDVEWVRIYHFVQAKFRLNHFLEVLFS